MHITLHPVTLTPDPQIDLSGGPRFSNTYLEDSNRDPQSNIMWDNAKWEWSLQYVGESVLMASIMGFYLARGGGAYAWWFLDPFDQYDSDHNAQGYVKLASDGKRYLNKIYPDTVPNSPYKYARRIYCPIPGTITITNASGVTSVNQYTGEVAGATQDGPATFQFRSPVKFATDFMELRRQPGDAGSTWQIQVQEIGKFLVAP